MNIVKSPLLGNFVNILPRVVVIDQNQVPLALLLAARELASVAQVLDEFPVAVNGPMMGRMLAWPVPEAPEASPRSSPQDI